jgi:hypothetical protein
MSSTFDESFLQEFKLVVDDPGLYWCGTVITYHHVHHACSATVDCHWFETKRRIDEHRMTYFKWLFAFNIPT